MSLILELAERGWLPDGVICVGIRQLLRQRLAAERTRTSEGAGGLDDHLAAMRAGPIAIEVDAANTQHYEVPAALFEAVLGPHLKYSCGHWPEGVSTLDEAEASMLALTCERAGLTDGMRVMDLGCGWGALALWVAERYPQTEVLAVSNSTSQRHFIEHRRTARGLSNLRVVTADVNQYEPSDRFDRVVSVEMFEHLRNVEALLERIGAWLVPDGRLFVHVFSHHRYAYFYDVDGESDWMARHFFTGGMMPSDRLLAACDGPLGVEAQWTVDGRHYGRTARAWLANLDRQRDAALDVLRADLGTTEGTRWLQRWRLFFLACAELFEYRNGAEWRVTHHRLALR
ncbi:MAG: SAM-dependent methyltransferase [Acidobacteria bacterium]|nr:SAM-dependent methyltransferase [Acidobacteriota bacterium]|tara:strand:- start:14 stop:1042 length:1029 start_codon:yes stop_codon:yes gene_type:complete